MTLRIPLVIFVVVTGMSQDCQSMHQVYVMNNSTLRLSCDHKATINSIVWLGPPGFTTYADGLVINENINKNGRLEISGNHSLGEFDLVLKEFLTSDEGIFQCHTVSSGKAMKAEFSVSVMRPPSNMVIHAEEEVDNRIYCFANRSVFLNCTVESGVPSEIIYWERSGRLVASGGPGNLLYSFLASASYHLNMFSCKAKNAAVKHPLEKIVQTYVYVLPTVQIAATPTTLLTTGENLKIVCEFTSNHPNVQISIQQVKTTGKITRFITSTLLIENVQRHHAGIYLCTAANPVGSATDKVNIVIKYAPLITTSQHTYYGEIGNQADIRLEVASYSIPSVSWMTSGTFGKFGRWNIFENKFSDAFLLSSSILPTKTEHFKNYSIRIRNSEGIADTDIELREYENTVYMEPTITECNTSSTVTIMCYLEQLEYSSWSSTWTHYRDDTFIRSIDSTTKYNMTRLDIQFCDYQDTGTYVCTWSRQSRELKAYAYVQVKAQPIFTDQSINANDTFIELKMLFYSHEYPEEISWYYEHGNQSRGNHLQQMCENTSVILTCYNKKVTVDGYVALLSGKVDILVSRDISCFIRNSFGTSEAVFSVQNIRKNNLEDRSNSTNSTTYIVSTTKRDTYSFKMSTNTSDTKEMHLYVLVALSVILFGGGTLCTVVVCFITRILKRVYMINISPNLPTVEYISPDPIPIYEEINVPEHITPVTSSNVQSDDESGSIEELELHDDKSVSSHSYQDLESVNSSCHDYLIIEMLSDDVLGDEPEMYAVDVNDEQQEKDEERNCVGTQVLDGEVECEPFECTSDVDE